MHKKFTPFLLTLLILIAFACGPTIPIPSTPANPDGGPTQQMDESPTATLPPTVAPTATVYPPVFDSAALGDNRVLDGFILTRHDITTGGGEVIENRDTIGYIKEPFSAYHLSTYPYGKKPSQQYLISGLLYETNMSIPEGWRLTLEPQPEDIDYYLRSPADMREIYNTDFGPISAQFVAQEDYQGIPANHFTLDQTNLRGGTDPSGTYKIEAAQGDLYLAQDGNYLLYFHIKFTGNVYSGGGAEYLAGVREYTEELTSINQMPEITLPADFPALELEHVALPEELRLQSVFRGNDGRNYDLYYYYMPVTMSYAEFLKFYRDLAPTNGWTISQVGPIPEEPSCREDCATLNNGNAKIILFEPSVCDSNMPAGYTCIGALYYR